MTISIAEVLDVDIAAIGIVVPARNEEERLPRCLAGLDAAIRQLRSAESDPPRIRIIVVVDGSTDGTYRIASEWPGVEVLSSDAGRVGAARAAGVRHLLETESAAGTAAGDMWIACTDADSAVPADWLQTQLVHARSGVELLLGTVRPDPQELAAGVLAAYRLRHLITDGHPHVHGANLGVRADTYLSVGSFQDVVEPRGRPAQPRGAGGRWAGAQHRGQPGADQRAEHWPGARGYGPLSAGAGRRASRWKRDGPTELRRIRFPPDRSAR